MHTQEATAIVSTRVVRFTTLDELLPYAQDWDRLAADVPFRSWPWLSGWWRHYGPAPARGGRAASLFVLGVFDQEDHLIGIAPWYLDRSTWQGRVLRFLGSGEVCSEYLGVLAAPGLEDAVVMALADWLSSARGRDAWDLLELTDLSAEDGVVARLAEATRGPRQPDPSTSRLQLLADRAARHVGRVSRNAFQAASQPSAQGGAAAPWQRPGRHRVGPPARGPPRKRNGSSSSCTRRGERRWASRAPSPPTGSPRFTAK